MLSVLVAKEVSTIDRRFLKLVRCFSLFNSFAVLAAEILPFLNWDWNGPHLPWKEEGEAEEEAGGAEEEEEEEAEEKEEEAEEKEEEAEEEEEEAEEEEEEAEEEEEEAEEEEEEAEEEEENEAEEDEKEAEEDEKEAEEEEDKNGEVNGLLINGESLTWRTNEGETLGTPTNLPWWRVVICGPYSSMKRPWNLSARSHSSVNKARRFKLIYRRK